MNVLAPWSVALLALPIAGAVTAPTPGAPPNRAERVQPNDNRRPAGVRRGDTLTLRLEARVGSWHPDGDDGPGASVPAFGLAGGPLQIPGPLIRVPAGTVVAIVVRNLLVPGDTLAVHGLHSRPAAAGPDVPLRVPPGAERSVRLRLDAPGTYYYWGTTTGRPLAVRTREDAQLSGAIVVDPRAQRPPPDRVLVIGAWLDTTGVAAREIGAARQRILFVVNGRSWPHTERLSHTVGDSVRWRLINASADLHPMHLHGFYFRVDARGDGRRDSSYAPAEAPRAVTDLLVPGRTMALTWVPERPGNWLFHCHIPGHFGARGPLGMPRDTAGAVGSHHVANHAIQGMNGLVMGVHVRPRGAAAAAPDVDTRRRLRLLVRPSAGGSSASPIYGYALHEGDGPEPAADSGVRAGPTIVLKRGTPVSITVVNRLPEETAVHWHGIELESYFDGVAGFSGDRARLSPAIAPGDSFEVRFAPPRAGTFIYHTHVDELRQQPAGLSGALVVVEDGHDPTVDIPVLITSPRERAVEARAVLLNGALSPAPVPVRVGVAHRLRLINITVARPGMRMELRRDSVRLAWRAVAKDGAELPDAHRTVRPAAQAISIGETYDVEFTPTVAGDTRLEAWTGNGRQRLGVLVLRATAEGPPRPP